MELTNQSLTKQFLTNHDQWGPFTDEVIPSLRLLFSVIKLALKVSSLVAITEVFGRHELTITVPIISRACVSSFNGFHGHRIGSFGCPIAWLRARDNA